MLEELRETKGLVATVCLSGVVDPDFAAHLSDMRAFNQSQDLNQIEYKTFHAVLVEAGRDQVVAHALQQGYDWVLQIDADAAPFSPQSLLRMLEIVMKPGGPDVLGAYAQLKGYPHLPTIDTGSGTWEEHYPGEGVIPVMRTGCHFFLARTEIFRAFGPPWFRTRLPQTPLMAMRDLDNFARLNNDGQNPLRTADWEKLQEKAAEQDPVMAAPVGEDSSFFDTLNALGFKVAVHTDLVAGHITRKLIKPQDLKEAMDKRDMAYRAGLGVA